MKRKNNKLNNLRAGKSPRCLANEFVRRLKNCLTEDEILAICLRNTKNEYKDCCASHDFIDANMVMSDAFEAVIGHEMNADSDADSSLWNSAWDIAKREYLTATKTLKLSGKMVAIPMEDNDDTAVALGDTPEYRQGHHDGRCEVKAAGDVLAATLRGIRDALAIEGGFKPTIAVIDEKLLHWEDV